MKASELISNLQKAIAVDGDLDVVFVGNDMDKEDIAGIATSEEDGTFWLCNDSAYDVIHVGGDDEEEQEKQ